MRNKKRSQGEVITTVLIILLVIAAVFIIWVVIRGFISGKVKGIGTERLDIPLTTQANTLSQSTITIPVTRGVGDAELASVRIVFKNATNTWVYENSTIVPDELETATYIVDLINHSTGSPFISNVLSYDIYPVLKSGTAGLPVHGSIAGSSGGHGWTAVCVSACIGKNCGENDGCGGKCFGTCPSGQFCNNNKVCENNPPVLQVCYKDADNDGYSNGITETVVTCSLGYKLASALIATSGDCNDNDARTYPGAQNVCDGTPTAGCGQLSSMNCNGWATDSQCSWVYQRCGGTPNCAGKTQGLCNGDPSENPGECVMICTWQEETAECVSNAGCDSLTETPNICYASRYHGCGCDAVEACTGTMNHCSGMINSGVCSAVGCEWHENCY